MKTTERLADLQSQIEHHVTKAYPRRVARKRTKSVAAAPPMQVPEEEPPPPTLLNPRAAWEAAADIMVARAFETHKDLAEACLQPSVVVYIEVSSDWLHWVAEAWGRALHPGAPHPIDGDSWEVDIGRTCSENFDDGKWCEYRRETPPVKSKGQGTRALAWALTSGLPTYAFAPSLDCLPAAFAKVYERHVVIPPLYGSVLSKVVEAICGSRPSRQIPDDVVGDVTEADMILAMRPSQTADEYVDRVLRLASKKSAPDKPVISLDHVGGMYEAVAWGRSLARDLEDFKAGRIAWADVDPGALLHGKPGTGKTTFAKALAGSCGVPLLTGSLTEWQASGTGHLGDTLKAMRAIFDKARKDAPCILFLDELDSFQSRDSERGDHASYHVQVVNCLLELLDGIHGRQGVVVVGACNDPGRLDDAMVRAGRLDTRIEIPLPDHESLVRIFRIHLGEQLADVDLTPAAAKAEGHTGADVKRWVRRARRIARTARRPLVVDDLLAAIDVPDVVVTAEDRRRYAVHEAGHAIWMAIHRPGALIAVTVRQTTQTGGETISRPDPSFTGATISTMRSALGFLLAGRAAEKIVFGEPCLGAGGSVNSDLAKATLLAVTTIVTYGLGDAPVWLTATVTTGNVKDVLSKHPTVAAEVELLLVECQQEALEVLGPMRAKIERLADMLVENETVPGADVERLVSVRTSPSPAPCDVSDRK